VEDVAAALHAGLIAGGVEFAVYLPDSVTGGLTSRLENDPAITAMLCAREDEGIGMAAGFFVAGRRAVVIMECSGIGYAALILARCQAQRTPVLIIASHGGAIGEPHGSHTVPIAAARGVVDGLRIEHFVLRAGDDPAEIVRLALQTVYGQGTSLVLFLPPYLMAA